MEQIQGNAITQISDTAHQKVLEVLKLFDNLSNKKECWLCNKIANALKGGKEITEEEKWHFITCVLSWTKLEPTSQMQFADNAN